MGLNYESSIEGHFRREICRGCLYVDGCKRGIYKKVDKEVLPELTFIKCKNYVRRPTNEEIGQIYGGADN